VAYWQGRGAWGWGPKPPVADQPKADEKPLDDRLGKDAPRWAVLVSYISKDGEVTTEKAEVQVRQYEQSARIGRTPDLVVEMEAGRLARNVMRKRNLRG
jgi:hypothetical protein